MIFSVEQAAYHAYCKEHFLVDRPNGPKGYAFVHFFRPMMLELDQELIPVSKDAFIIFSHGIRQHYYPQTSDMLENWCHFECDHFPEFIHSLGIELNRPFWIRDSAGADTLFQTIASSYYDSNLQAVDFGMHALFYYLASASRLYTNHYGEEMQKLYDFRTLLQSRLEEDWTVSSMAETLNYSPSYFNKLYGDTFGISPKQDLSKMRMERAKYLLSSTSYAVSHISHLLHYTSSTSFISKFHRYAGMTPLQYRKQWGNK